jgi:hypothetical protein
MDLRGPPCNGPRADMDGPARPAPFVGDRSLFDIGADELH